MSHNSAFQKHEEHIGLKETEAMHVMSTLPRNHSYSVKVGRVTADTTHTPMQCFHVVGSYMDLCGSYMDHHDNLCTTQYVSWKTETIEISNAM